MSDALHCVIATGGNPFSHSRNRMTAAATLLLEAGTAAGAIRPDVEPADVLASLSGVTFATGDPGQREQASRLLDLLMDGLRYQPAR